MILKDDISIETPEEPLIGLALETLVGLLIGADSVVNENVSFVRELPSEAFTNQVYVVE